MADRILSVQTVKAAGDAAAADANKIILPELWNEAKGHGGVFGQGYSVSGSDYYSSDRVVYVFDNFTGSFDLIQESGSTAGLTVYDTETTPESGPWRLISGPPQYLYMSGSNIQDVKVTIVLVR